MRYPANHKERTRQKVIDLAAADLCVNGIERTGISEIMRSAGLTHGGFYAHFASKDEMVAAAVTHMFARLTEKLETGIRHYGPARTFGLFVDAYLSIKHRDNPANGCPIAALAGEIQRQPACTKDAYSAGLTRYLQTIAALLPPAEGKQRPDVAASLLMEMVGALLLARCTVNDQASKRVLKKAKHSVEMRFGDLPAQGPRARTGSPD